MRFKPTTAAGETATLTVTIPAGSDPPAQGEPYGHWQLDDLFLKAKPPGEIKSSRRLSTSRSSLFLAHKVTVIGIGKVLDL